MLVRDVQPGDYFTLNNKLLGEPAFIKLAKYQPNNYNVVNTASWAVGHVDEDDEVFQVLTLTLKVQE